MSMPARYSSVLVAPLAGLPQTMQLGADPHLRLTIAAMLPDLAALLSAPADRTVRASAGQRRTTPGEQVAREPWETADAVAHAALTATGRRTAGDEAAHVLLIVRTGAALAAIWPPIAGRPLEVEHEGRLLGSLWVERLEVVAGALVASGVPGSAFDIGWLPGLFEPAPSTGDGYAHLR